RAGFGLRFDGREDTLTSLFADTFRMTDNQMIADLTAFLLAFPQDSYAGVGKQFSLHGPEGLPLLLPILDTSNYGEIVVRGVKDGLNRGWHSVYTEGV